MDAEENVRYRMQGYSKSESHTTYHLTKLYQEEIIDKTPNNQYQLKALSWENDQN